MSNFVFLFSLSFILFTSSFLHAGGSSIVGPGNPAALFCERDGGVLVRYSIQQNQSALCDFSNPATNEDSLAAVGQQSYYRWAQKHSIKSIEAYFKSSLKKNQTESESSIIQYCEQSEGAITLVKIHSNDKNLLLCEFSDHSQIDALTLFRGHEHLKNFNLSGKLLTKRN